jgi:hypothetical protein
MKQSHMGQFLVAAQLHRARVPLEQHRHNPLAQGLGPCTVHSRGARSPAVLPRQRGAADRW